MKIEDLQNKKVAILGLGIEGLALASFLDGKVKNITLLDRASEEELNEKSEENIQLRKVLDKGYNKVFGEKYLDYLGDYKFIFRSPGVKVLEPKIQDARLNGVKVSSQIKLFFDLCPAKIIGVTGTKGKGTTSSLIESMMKEDGFKVHLAGNIGEPAITLLDKIESSDWVILELSSFQLQDLKISPHIAVITNIAVDHLDYHKDEEEYILAKESISKYQKSDDIIIANKDNENAVKISNISNGKKLFFSGKEECDGFVKGDKVFVRIDDNYIEICSASEIQLVGKHNLENITSAALASIAAGAQIDSIKKGAKNFQGLSHRLELAGKKNGKKFFNDSFATNPEPTIAAINSFDEPITIILGGSSKGADFSKLASEIVKSSVNNVILIGDEADKIEKALIEENYSKSIVKMEGDMQDFVNKADEVSKSGDVILLSPACASFGLFNNYKERGYKFIEIVKNLN